ncbi:MAG: hypothetical protein WCS52_18130 [bacterium]
MRNSLIAYSLQPKHLPLLSAWRTLLAAYLVVMPLVSLATLTNDDAWVSGKLSSASVGRTGKIAVQLILLQDEPAEVSISLILPAGFSCETGSRKVLLEPDAPRLESFTLINHTSMPGGTYPVTALVEQVQGSFPVGGALCAATSTQDRAQSVAAHSAPPTGKGKAASFSSEITVTEAQWVGQSYWFWGALSAFLLLGWLTLTFRQRRLPIPLTATGSFFDAAVLTGLCVFTLWQFSPVDLIRNTTPVGGDTPAHLYLVSHLKEQLLHHGRIISWAGGWWCGFPMFQYYFVLPYMSAAFLSVLIPLNIAFKVVSIAGMVLTPCCAYWAARVWRVPGPGPLVMALAMVPFLFVQSHTMWGVNTSSTLAGMIANSWSFALMLPALAYGAKDISDGEVRMRTILLFVLVLASHFFTSVIMFVTLAIVPVLPKTPSFLRGLRVLAVEAGLALLLMGWWLIPLIAKSDCSMDFGVNWELSLVRSFPEYSVGVLIFAGVALVAGIRRSLPVVWLLAWMLAVSVVLFKGGQTLSPVFVNVRLWPFIFFALMALGAVGAGVLLERTRRGRVWVCLLVPAVLGAVVLSESIGGIGAPGLTHAWAKWNFSGLESKPSAAVFTKLIPLLKGSPGRLANDLCEENNQLGSSRIFELVPHLIGKPIFEGGLVNSGLGSMYSYYIQGESSPSCAGFPPIVIPATFDFTRATRHLELFNVKHFIARSTLTRQALRSMKEWRFMAREEEWELYELMTHEGRYVFIPPRLPKVVATDRWKERSLAWLYDVKALDQFVIWKMPGMTVDRPELARGGQPISLAGTQCISDEVVTDDRIRFRTTALGLPHIIKVTWFPNWKVRGAKQVYCVSPGFMCVFPDQAEVELYYGTTGSDIVGYLATTLGGLIIMIWIVSRRRKS